jgi:hypothetical protein
VSGFRDNAGAAAKALRRMTGWDRVRPHLSNSGAGTNVLRAGLYRLFFLFQFCSSGAYFLGQTRLRTQKIGRTAKHAKTNATGEQASTKKERMTTLGPFAACQLCARTASEEDIRDLKHFT